jgi:hypothetical protein
VPRGRKSGFASVEMTKEKGNVSIESGCWTEGVFHHLGCVAGPGQLGRKTFPGRGVNTEISPLRFAPVEMTKEKGNGSIESGCWTEGVFHHLGRAAGLGQLGRKTSPGRGVNTEISPLRFAPVEMTRCGRTNTAFTMINVGCHDSFGSEPSRCPVEEQPFVIPQNCHLDRSEAEWRDLRFLSPASSILAGDAEAKLLRLDGILSLCLGE